MKKSVEPAWAYHWYYVYIGSQLHRYLYKLTSMVSTLLIFSGRPSLKCFSPSLNPKIDKRIPSFERQKRQISFKFKMPMLFLSNSSVLFICTRLIELNSLLKNNTTATELKHHLNKLQPITTLSMGIFYFYTLEVL